MKIDEIANRWIRRARAREEDKDTEEEIALIGAIIRGCRDVDHLKDVLRPLHGMMESHAEAIMHELCLYCENKADFESEDYKPLWDAARFVGTLRRGADEILEIAEAA